MPREIAWDRGLLETNNNYIFRNNCHEIKHGDIPHAPPSVCFRKNFFTILLTIGAKIFTANVLTNKPENKSSLLFNKIETSL